MNLVDDVLLYTGYSVSSLIGLYASIYSVHCKNSFILMLSESRENVCVSLTRHFYANNFDWCGKIFEYSYLSCYMHSVVEEPSLALTKIRVIP